MHRSGVLILLTATVALVAGAWLPVEGIAKLAAAPLERSGASGGDVAFLAGIAAGVALASGAWYTRRHWLRRQRDIQRVRERANRCRFERYPSIRSLPADRQGPT
jgi:hypothetical protein